MGIVIFLLIASVLVAGGFLIAFIWAIRHGQFDDLETPAVRVIFDETSVPLDKKQNNINEDN